MDPATIALLGQLANLAFQAVDGAVRVKAAYSAQEAGEIDALLEQATAKRREIAQGLRDAGPAPADDA